MRQGRTRRRSLNQPLHRFHDVRCSFRCNHFREGGGSCQLSADKLADAAGIVDVSTARNGLHRLKRYGWIIAEHVPRTKKRGLVYRPIMSVSAARSRWPTPRLSCYS